MNCPDCRSLKIWKDGLRYVQGRSIQRYLCRSCGYRFSEKYYKSYNLTCGRQICVLDEKAKNLVRAVTKPEALQETKNNINSNIVNFAWHLKKLGRKETTIRTYTNYVNKLAKVANLTSPETVKLAIATHFQDTNTKRSATYAYDSFTKFLDITWEKPRYNIEHKKVFIPTIEELKIAINSGRKGTIAFS